jgi:cytochrome c biogenesis protein CcmG, thiol:disulfide interchange protein DsbE
VSSQSGSRAPEGKTPVPPPRRRRRFAVWLLALVLLAALLVVGLAGHGSGADRSAPALPRTALVGSPVTLASLLGAPTASPLAASLHGTHPALVLFWASWCAPCQQEAPAVERFAHSATGRGRIVGVDYGESAATLPRAFVRRYRWSFPTLSDPDLTAAEAYRVRVLPTTFAIDSRGRIVATLSGPQTEQSLTRALAAAG